MKSKNCTWFNKQQRALSVLKDIYSAGKTYKNPSTWFTEQYQEKVVPILAKNVPSHAKSYISGYQHCLFDSMWQYMEFCYCVDGIWYTTSKGETVKPKLRDLENLNMSGNLCTHFWKDTYKPYTEISLVN